MRSNSSTRSAHWSISSAAARVRRGGGPDRADQSGVHPHRLTGQRDASGCVRSTRATTYTTAATPTGLVVVTELQPISAIFACPEDNVTVLMERMLRAGGTLIAEAYDRGNSNELADGRVKAVDNQIDTTTGTIKLRPCSPTRTGACSPTSSSISSSSSTCCRIRCHARAPRFTAARPNGVISTFVYLVNTADTRSRCGPSPSGVIDGERVAVIKGCAAGDIVVTEGGDRLRDGASGAVARQHDPTSANRPPRGANTTASTGQHRNRPNSGSAGTGVSAPPRNEPVTPLHPATGRHHPVDGGDPGRGPDRLPAVAAVGVAGSRLPDHPGADVLSGRQPGGHHLGDHGAAGKAVRPDARA